MIRASVNGCTNCVRLLVDAGADKNAKNHVRVPWLFTALLSNNFCLPVVLFVSRGDDVCVCVCVCVCVSAFVSVYVTRARVYMCGCGCV
jgi:hypothetical protein